MMLRKNPLYNVLVKWRRGRQAAPKRTANFSPPRLKGTFRYVLIIVVLLLLVLIGKFMVDYFRVNFKNLNDSYSLNIGKVYIENYFLYVTQADVEEDRKFVSDVYLVSVNTRSQNYHLLRIAPQFVAVVPYLNKSLELRTIYNNGLAANKDPYVALNSGAKNLLGIGVKGYIAIDQNNLPEIARSFNWKGDPNQLTDIKQLLSLNIVNWLSMLTNLPKLESLVSTTLSKQEILNFAGYMANYKMQKFINLSLNYGVEESYPFGKGYTPDYNLINQIITGITHSSDIVSEQVKVEVFNATGSIGLAGRTSRLLNNYNINVVRYSNAPRVESVTTLYVPERKDATVNIDLIKSLVKEDLRVINEQYEYNSTGDLVLVLAKDIIGE
jgi:hypothetical protein